MLSLRHCKVNHYFPNCQVFTLFFNVFNRIVLLLEYLFAFYGILLNLVYFCVSDKVKVGYGISRISYAKKSPTDLHRFHRFCFVI